MLARRCLDCTAITTTGPRCPTCRRQHDRTRRATTAERGYDSQWQKQSTEAIAAHRAAHGDWCPGYGRPSHYSDDLTLDHVVNGDRSMTLVLCRGCNTVKRNRERRGGAGQISRTDGGA